MTIHEQVNAVVRNKEYKRFLSTVAESLEFRLGLPRGRALVGTIGSGEERDNREALETWVANRWDWSIDGNARVATEVLASELVDKLSVGEF